jgi:uncharacterized BrkB/YihY/UPF0761 family membrane protein
MLRKKQNEMIKILLLLLFVFASSAFASTSTPQFLQDMGTTFTNMGKDVLIGILVLFVWVLAGLYAFLKNSGFPLKWAIVGSVFMAIAPFVAPKLISWASNF